jgi:hypothetical protein
MTEPPDAERDGRAQRWRRAKPLLTVGYAAGVPAMFPSRRIMRVRSRPAFAALLAAQALIAVGWIVAPPSRRRTRGVVVNSLGDVGVRRVVAEVGRLSGSAPPGGGLCN